MFSCFVSRLVIVISFSYSYNEMMAQKINLDLYKGQLDAFPHQFSFHIESTHIKRLRHHGTGKATDRRQRFPTIGSKYFNVKSFF